MTKKKNIKFYKKSHKYKLGRDDLTSVTSFISRYFEKFDASKIAKIKVIIDRKNGIKDTSITKYKNNWKESSINGTDTHELIEKGIYSLFECTDVEIISNDKANQAIKWLDWVQNTDKDIQLIPEAIIYSEEHKLAGTVDLIVLEKDKVTLVDWKTNKAIYTAGYKGKKALSPIDDLDDCNYIKYALQLSIYGYMLEKEYGFKVDNLQLLHLKDDKYVVMQIPYLRDKVEVLLNDKALK